MTRTTVDKKDSKKMTAVVLRRTLATLLILLVIGVCVGFYFGKNFLQKLGAATSQEVASAQSGDTQLANLVQLRKNLASNEAVIEKAKNVVASSQGYKYQDQIINDLTKFASQAGISVTGFTFVDSAAASSAALSGVKSTSVTITVGEGASYAQFLNFMRLTENNITKMQLTQLNLSRDSTKPEGVQVGSFMLEVYING